MTQNREERQEQILPANPTAVPLAIVGLGSIFPEADNKERFWTNICSGVDSIKEVPESHWKADDYYDQDPKSPDHVYAKMGGFLSPVAFNPMDFGILPNAMEAIDTSQLLGLLAVDQALNDAGYGAGREFDRERVSVVLGVTGTLELVIPLGARLGFPRWREALKDAGVAAERAEDVIQRISDSYVGWQENSFPGLLGNVVAGRVSKHFDLGGTNCVVDAACGSSLSAINLAAMELASGRSDMAISGGVDTFNDIFMYTCFSKTPALSPSGHARPYSAQADGTTLGEGLGIVVLKRLADAERDGDRIYAVLKGIGTSSDGRGSAIYEPSVAGQVKALQRAYQQAGVEPTTVELIEGHGTGTKVGDAVEIKALQQVFGTAETPWCALGSIKSQIGHTKAAAGSAGLIKAALALYHKVLPPSIKAEQPAETLTAEGCPFYLNSDIRPWIAQPDHPRRAGVSALGFGGSNFHCLLEEHRADKQQVDWHGDVQLIPFAAADAAALAAQLEPFSSASSWQQLRSFADQQRRAFDPQQPARLVLVIDQQSDRAAQKKNALSMLQNKPAAANWETPDGVFFGRGELAGETALLFPGQGAQYCGMLKELALCFPEFLATLEEADASFSALSQQPVGRLAERIYPRPAYLSDASATTAALQATEVAQPALGAVSLAAARVLARFGFDFQAAAGHSYGELTALCSAGVFDSETLFRLSRLRGELMAAGEGDRGSMLAVSAPLNEIEHFIADSGLKLVLANRNTPTQGILSGATAEIERAESLLAERGLAAKRLAVAAAFHSELVAEAAKPFAAELDRLNWQPATKAVYSNTSGERYPGELAALQQLLAKQLPSPVDFVHEIEAMYRAGVRTFVEVGPGARLTGMVKAILDQDDVQALALDGSNGRRGALVELGRLLAKLAALGMPLQLEQWDGDFAANQPTEVKKRKGVSIEISGSNYFKRPEKRPALAVELDPASVQSAAPAIPAPAAKATTRQGAAMAEQPSNQAQQAAPPTQNNPQALQDALQITQQSLQALQNLQDQTAKLHQQFLEGQQAATQSFVALVQQQQQLASGSGLTAPIAAAMTAPVASATTASVASATTTSVAPVPAPVAAPLPGSAPAAAAPVTVTAQPVAQVAAAAVASRPDTAPVLFAIIAEKTGYPTEMLELDMSLDADLGIDSIKRVEILSALQEQLPELPAIKPDDLATLQTLGQIVAHLDASAPAGAATAASAPQADFSGVLFSIIAEKTGYPSEMLEPEMALDADLGIDSIKRVEILSALQEQLPELPAIKPEDLATLQTLAQIIDHLAASAGATGAGVALATATAAIGRAEIEQVLLRVIAEKTGYPEAMLELEMALDADLGIDSIKRVEILSALQEELPELPAVKPEDLAVLQTLGQIVEHLSSQAPAALERVPTIPAAPQLGQLDSQQVAEVLLEVIAEKTGYPVEMLELEMALDADLGIDSIKRVEILSALQEKLPGAPAIKPEHLATLQTVGQIVDFLASNRPVGENKTAVADAPVASAPTSIRRQVLIDSPLSLARPSLEMSFKPGAVVWVNDDGSALSEAVCQQLTERALIPQRRPLSELAESEAPAELCGLVLIAPLKGCDDQFYQQAFSVVRQAAASLNDNGSHGGAFFATVSRLNGVFGLPRQKQPVNDALSGGLAGFSKTAAHEWPTVHCKALDLSMGLEIGSTAKTIVNEIFTRAPQEVGITSTGLTSLELADEQLTAGHAELPLNEGDLVVISGGARGVTAEVAVALAQASKATLLLLGRTAMPTAEPVWLSGLVDEAAIKKGLLAQAETPLKPRELEQACQKILAEREIRHNLDRILNAGGRPLYRGVDLRDAAAVAAVIDEQRQQFGPVKGVVHGAGVLADKLISDKTDAQFAEVYSTKVDGLRALLAATAKDPLAFVTLFSSSTGRFGRSGQVDYAVANEILNKTAQKLTETHPDCRVVSCNWGPWDGGMVTAGLKKLFAEEGIEVIDLQTGANYLLDEISQPTSAPVEMVILGGEPPAENDSEAVHNVHFSKAFELELTVDQFPFLKSHVLDGKAVLPMAVIIEWMSHAAMHNNPGLKFQGFNDLRILKGVILEAEQTLELAVYTGKAFKADGVHIVPVELASKDSSGQQQVYARSRIVLAATLAEAKQAAELLPLPAYEHDQSQLYGSEQLFHGSDFQGLRSIAGCSADGISALAAAAPPPQAWIEQPLRNSWLADPLVLDSSFQLLILWSFDQHQAGSLPVFAGRYRQFCQQFPQSDVEIRARIVDQQQYRAVADIDFVDPADGRLLARLEDYECIIDANLSASFRRNRLTGVA